jgi:hypothetical protein
MPLKTKSIASPEINILWRNWIKVFLKYPFSYLPLNSHPDLVATKTKKPNYRRLILRQLGHAETCSAPAAFRPPSHEGFGFIRRISSVKKYSMILSKGQILSTKKSFSLSTGVKWCQIKDKDLWISR